jgi:hypothetical protein
MTSIMTFISMIMSLFSMSTGAVSQAAAMRQQLRPPTQAQQSTQCPGGTVGQVQQLPDGSYQVVCVQTYAGQP